MSRIQTQATSDSYGSALTLSAGTTQVEISFLSAGALVAGTIKIKDPGDNVVEMPIGAGESYVMNLSKGSAALGSGWRIELKAASGTPTGQLLET